MIGQTLSHFKITAKLGEGGMGEVYRAEDTKLDRDVAIKVLPEGFTTDPERLARFEREAKLLAALNHPNIAGIYEVDEATDEDGTKFLFLAMELAAGEDLSERLSRGPMPVDEALAAALQIAMALEAAHDRGVVHRDLKPANVKLASEGAGVSVKVLDFGLAKAWESGESSPDMTRSPTLTAQMTQAGVILGTAGYMSPEQARAQEADRRSDIWSFGVVLYEMLTGQRLFAADTVSDTLARVLTFDPVWEELDVDLPAPLVALLERCLDRDASQRLQAIGEARIAIDRYLADPEALTVGTSAAEVSPPAKRSALRWVGLAVLLLVAGGIGSEIRNRSIPPPGPVHFTIMPPGEAHYQPANHLGLDVSPDGRFVVFSTFDNENLRLAVKSPDRGEPQVLEGTDGGRNPFFSPDGEWVGFFDDTHLTKVALRGGNPIQIAEKEQTRGAVWLEDNTIVFTADTEGGLFRISAHGGQVEALTELDSERNERTHRWPTALPGGKVVLFTSDTFETTEYYDDARIEAVDIASGERKVILERTSMVRFLPTIGQLLYAQAGTIFAVPFDPVGLEVTGESRVVLRDVLTLVTSGAAQFAVSRRGDLVYVEGDKLGGRMQLTWIDRDGLVEAVQPDDLFYIQAKLSPSGKQAAVIIPSQDGQDLWVLDMERATPTRLTFEGVASHPVWSPDGTHIFITYNLGADPPRLMKKRADGTGALEELWDRDWARPESVHPDGSLLVVEVYEEGAIGDFTSDQWILDLTGDSEPESFLQGPENVIQAEISPDGRWIAYSSDESGRMEVYVRPFPEGEGKWQISTAGGREPRWLPGSQELLYRSGSGIHGVPFETDAGFQAGLPVFLSDQVGGAPYGPLYTPHPDGQRILTLTGSVSEQEWRIQSRLHWAEELKPLLEQ